MKYLFCIGLCLGWCAAPGFAQTCNQPGALLSVRNTVQEPFEYIVFTFFAPYEGKGSLYRSDSGPFTQQPLSNPIRVRGDQFYQIKFENVRVICDTRQYTQLPRKKVQDIKPLQRSDGTLIYVIGLQDSARIAAHSSLNYQGFHIVKIRVQ